MLPRATLHELFEIFFGKKSDLNVAGKILLSPFIIYCIITWWLLEICFTKDNEERKKTEED